MLTTVTTAFVWAVTGWLSHILYRQVRYVIQLGLQSRIQPAAEDPYQTLHDDYVNFRGDLPDPDRPYPANRFRAERRELDWIEILPAPMVPTTYATEKIIGLRTEIPTALMFDHD